jgi:hypothetical protein
MSGHHERHEPKPPSGWMDRPDTVKRFFLVIYVISGLLIVAELILGKETAHPHPYEWVPLFYAAYGFASFWFLVLLAKPMRRLLIRSEDYYERGDDE